ncbi:chloroplastic group iia intron splicing facilitator crs1 chloroplastic [Phtheirospermum japonicum]|uniref:Chloroplastic group iia intron splicing facilitator crs1 chloroplastic n=1 Tax=Phtheirospermum japonicum TaxID=374723 RepID=A0A830CCU3_9LAMI|nr:chloroplastic group iia intron splicing facilitator crs1 chloroplastic [Phtheirospermum japonicum]
MSSTPFLTHFSNAITPFPHNPPKIPTPLISSTPKYSFKTFSNPPNNSHNSAKIERTSTEYENQHDSHTKSSGPNPHSGPTIKAPTAPWMNKPLLVKPNEIVKFTNPKNRKDYLSYGRNEEHPDTGLTGKVEGARGKVAMKKIFKGIEKLQEIENSDETKQTLENPKFKFGPGDLWGNGDCESVAEMNGNRLESTEFDIPFAEVVKEVRLRKLPWERDEKMVIGRVKKEKVVTAAELNLDGILLERLRHEAGMIKKWVKVKKAGVTQAVVEQVRFIWRNNELALLRFDVPLCRNMDRAREIVEMKTGGMVVWRNKDFLAVYRGCNYESGSKHILYIHRNTIRDRENSSSTMNYRSTTTTFARESSHRSSPDENICRDGSNFESLLTASLYEREADRLLDGLGPRFVDWWMQKPLPVDGDLLPELVPGFKTPFRLCPPFTRSKLTDVELTYLRKLARPLPTHFVLGRNRNLQGLAAAILKLWEKCHIAKIALKWGNLTGGILLLRNKFLIILYRGKDFIPSEVAKIVNERETVLTRYQLQEESARIKASESISITDEQTLNSGITGTLSEFHSIHSDNRQGETEVELQLEAEKERLEKELKDQERKLFILKKKIEKSAGILEKLNNESRSSEKDPDVEILSEEERRCLREMGLKIDSSLVLGRRGVYDGVIEGMHQHWKHREIVKVITMQKNFSQVMHTAKCVEAESGGTLVSIVKLKEGHAIIVYRGKNYKRPKTAAINLLNKREALSRSLEIQRLGSLKFFARQREQAIKDLKHKLAELQERINDCRHL